MLDRNVQSHFSLKLNVFCYDLNLIKHDDDAMTYSRQSRLTTFTGIIQFYFTILHAAPKITQLLRHKKKLAAKINSLNIIPCILNLRSSQIK